MSRTIAIRNLDFFIDEQLLTLIFCEFGLILKIDLLRDDISRTSRGEAFIEFKDLSAAEASVQKMHDSVLNGRKIQVQQEL